MSSLLKTVARIACIAKQDGYARLDELLVEVYLNKLLHTLSLLAYALCLSYPCCRGEVAW